MCTPECIISTVSNELETSLQTIVNIMIIQDRYVKRSNRFHLHSPSDTRTYTTATLQAVRSARCLHIHKWTRDILECTFHSTVLFSYGFVRTTCEDTSHKRTKKRTRMHYAAVSMFSDISQPGKCTLFD